MSAARPIPEALLERYLAGDLGPDERRVLEAQLEASQSDRKRLEALRADTAAFLVQRPPGPMVAKLEAGQASRPQWWTWLAAPLAAAAALVFFVITREPEVALKGDLALAVYQQTAAGAQRLEPDAALEAGAKLRFEVRAAHDGFVAVLSRDGAGHVTVYYPFQGTAAAPYRAAEPLLPGAIALDGTPGSEDAWALYGEEAFVLAALIAQLEKGAEPAAKGVSVTRVSWKKR